MDVEVTIIGAGVIGLAIFAELSSVIESLYLIERHKKFGQETSSHNSEVIHAGLYYQPNSLKANLCLEGNELLRSYCKSHDIPYKMLGKLVVGSEKEKYDIERLYENAKKSGAVGVSILSRDELLKKEPLLSSSFALFSENTGIVDTHSLMESFLSKAVDNGGNIVYNTEVAKIEFLSPGYRIYTKNANGEEFSYSSEKVINASGLYSDQIAKLVGIDTKQCSYELHWCKGHYFSLNSKLSKSFKHLIYPVPSTIFSGLGIHITLDLNGRVRLGPDVKYILDKSKQDYTVDESLNILFKESVERYFPLLELADISPEFAGIRPKLQGPNEQQRDFIINEESKKGFPGFINLIGIESPGITASLAIARYVSNLI